MDMKGVTVLGQSDLFRMIETVKPRKATEEKREKLELKKKSEARAAKWPNTISAQRAKKEKLRRARLDVEEDERRKIDAIEAEIMAESRRLQIDRAKKKLYDNNDRVKALHSSLLLSEVLDERVSQIEYKKKIKELRKLEAIAFNVQQAKELEVKEEEEERAIYARRKAALEQKHEQLKQLEQVKAKIALEKKRDLEEGELLRREAEEEAIRQHEKELKVREVARKHTMETMKANDALQKYKLKELNREKAAEKAQEAYAAKKEAFQLERKRREVEKENGKQKARDRMIRLMEDQLEAARKKNERNYELQHQQAVAKEDGILAERAERRRKEKIAIDKSRKQQLAIRNAMKEQKNADDKAFLDAWKERTKELAEEDELETKMKFWENKQHQQFLKHQMDFKAKKKMQRKTKELEGAYVAALSIAEEEDTFKAYASVCIDEWNKRGKSLRPMQLLLNAKDALGSTK
ncbi:hypothetical protein HOP50_01g01620 [Chloropicon primus]|uniref:Trichohyalin-plectin-homology domain-containing protein n=1 Tax=Chloropicon primus TaxID=1764295 RepID=A0A5B8MDF7_9CHLO|nr:hypothetical protein A3770_01p01730 [Chloropicon primus]UPQ96871.1 hypothetical protein HOP50_01g01620 [Chloropicon primus]|eukprot:QDZ17655.1 hypothetical protein A3770_01p01730 [Chloropicon primus]